MASHSTKQAIWKVKAVSSNSSALNKIDTETATLCERENFLATIRIEKAHIKSELASRFLSDLERKTKNEIIAIKRSLLIGHRLNQRVKLTARQHGHFTPFVAPSLDVGLKRIRDQDNILLRMTMHLSHTYRVENKLKKRARYLTAPASAENPRLATNESEERIKAVCERLNRECATTITPLEFRNLHNRDGNLRIHRGDIILDHISRRYNIIDLLGCGAYGQVLKVKDSDNGIHALKILNTKRQTNKFTESKVLKLIEYHGRSGRDFVVGLESSFLFRSTFPCMLFQEHGISLYDHIQHNGSFVMSDLVIILKQVLLAIREVHTLGFVHSDIKPENVLFRYPQSVIATKSTCDGIGRSCLSTSMPIPARLAVVLIDFGTTFGSAANSPGWAVKYIQSRFYRAPEVFLECRYGRRQYIYDTPIDMWSLGCLAMELYLGQPLFEGRSSLEMINGIVNLLGPIPEYMLNLASSSDTVVEKSGVKEIKPCNSNSSNYLPTRRFSVSSLFDFIQGHLVCRTCQKDLICSLDMRKSFMNLVSGLLQVDPKSRLTCGKAIRHLFFCKEIPEEIINEIPNGHINESFKTFRIDTFIPPRQHSKSLLIVETADSTASIFSPQPHIPRAPLHYNFKKMLWMDLMLVKRKSRVAATHNSSRMGQAGHQQTNSLAAESTVLSKTTKGSAEQRPESSGSRGSSVYMTDASSRPESSLSFHSNQSEQILAKPVASTDLSQHCRDTKDQKNNYSKGNKQHMQEGHGYQRPYTHMENAPITPNVHRVHPQSYYYANTNSMPYFPYHHQHSSVIPADMLHNVHLQSEMRSRQYHFHSSSQQSLGSSYAQSSQSPSVGTVPTAAMMQMYPHAASADSYTPVHHQSRPLLSYHPHQHHTQYPPQEPSFVHQPVYSYTPQQINVPPSHHPYHHRQHPTHVQPFPHAQGAGYVHPLPYVRPVYPPVTNNASVAEGQLVYGIQHIPNIPQNAEIFFEQL